MRYILYIFFFSVTAFAQQDSIQKIRTIEGRPNATFLQTLENQMPNCFIIGVGNPNDFYNTYKLTEADKDSIYKAAFNGPIAQAAIKAKFNGKSKLYEKGYEIELVSLLIIDSISCEDKKKLLVGRILGDIKYDYEPNAYPKEAYFNGIPYKIINGCALTGLPRREDRKAALEDFIAQEKTINFSALIYVIDNQPFFARGEKNMQMLFKKLKETEVAMLIFLTGATATAIYGNAGSNGVLIINSNN